MLLTSLGDMVLEGVNYIFLVIDSFVYGVVNKIYRVYMTLAGARIFSSKLFSAISNRVYAVIGIVMLFVLAYSLIQGIISPDKITKGAGSGGNLVRRVLVAVIGLAIVPAVFNLAYKAQEIILANDVIGKIFLGFDDDKNMIKHNSITIDNEETVPAGEINQNEGIKTQAGTITAVSIWQAFFYPTDTETEDVASTIEAKDAPLFIKGKGNLSKWGCGIALGVSFFIPGAILAAATVCALAIPISAAENVLTKVITLKQAYGAAAGSGSFAYFPAFAKNVVEGDIRYVLILSTITGIVCIYLFLSFAIDMAVRAAKLAFLELIAPIPLMLQILPDSKSQGSFKTWYTNCLQLFFQVFIRLAMVYIIVYLIAHLDYILDSIMSQGIKDDFFANIVLKILLIFGLLIFAKEAPEFISKSLGIDANIMGGIGLRSKLDKGGVFAAGAAVGGIGANVLSGMGRGIQDGINQYKNDTKNRGIARFGKALGAGTVGAATKGIGQGIRSVPRAIFDSRGTNAPHDIREMVNRVNDSHVSTRAAIEASERKKEERRKEFRDAAGLDENDKLIDPRTWLDQAGGTVKVAKGRVAKGFRDFTGIPKDTSYYTEELGNATNIAEIGKALDGTVDDARKVQDALRNIERAKSDVTEKRLAQRIADKDYGGDISKVYASDAEMAKVHRQQDQLIADAQAKAKVARAQAVQEALEQAAAGKENATSRKLAQLLDQNRDSFIKHSKDRMADGRTLEDTLKSMFGDDVLAGGHIDYSRAASRGNSSMDISVTGNNGTENVTTKIRLRTRTENGKTERKYLFHTDDGHEHVADSMEQALQALGISSVSETKATALGSTSQKGIKDLHAALHDIGTDLVLDNGSIVHTTGTAEELATAIGSHRIKVSENYLQALADTAGAGNGWEVVIDFGAAGKRTVRYDASSNNYVLVDENGVETTKDALADLSASISGGLVDASTVFTGDATSIVSEAKTIGGENQTYVLSSADYQDAMRNKQTNSGGNRGGKK